MKRVGIVHVLCWVVLGLTGCAKQVPVPTSMADYTAKDGAFSCKYPAGWPAEGGSRPDNTYSWARFVQGPIKIKITADVTGSLIGDIAGAGMGGGFGAEMDPESAPVAVAHEMHQRAVADDYSGFEEGPPQVINTKLGDGRVAMFAASNKKIIGYRATFLTKNRRLTILCESPRKDWSRFKPVFQEIVKNVGR